MNSNTEQPWQILTDSGGSYEQWTDVPPKLQPLVSCWLKEHSPTYGLYSFPYRTIPIMGAFFDGYIGCLAAHKTLPQEEIEAIRFALKVFHMSVRQSASVMFRLKPIHEEPHP